MLLLGPRKYLQTSENHERMKEKGRDVTQAQEW
jgi:hypothetical protein